MDAYGKVLDGEPQLNLREALQKCDCHEQMFEKATGMSAQPPERPQPSGPGADQSKRC